MNPTDRADWDAIVSECRHVLSGRKANLIVQAADELSFLRDGVVKLQDELARVGQEKDCRTLDCERYKERISLAEKVMEAAKIMHNPEHWMRNKYCPVCAALNVYYTAGFILHGRGGR